MKRLLLGLFMAVLVTAKPELYREKEDFQYSRSSSDEGTKSGYYDAQRGNMGGNYERAHNMDGLAQHQMGGLVKQVEGELGDGSKTRTGSVFTAANSQGIYGSGRYDLSSLEGRNFQEGATFHDSQSYASAGSRAHSSQYSAQNSARFNADSQLRSSGYRGFQQSDNLQEAQNAYGTQGYEYGSQSQRGSKYYLQSGYQGSNDYERSNANHQTSNNFEAANSHNRLISTVPVRIVVRPGTRVAIPIATQTHSGSHVASYDQSSANSEAEVLNSGDQQAVFRPNGDAKHYESSYSYRKEWEKHDTKPVAVPLATPVYSIPKNSELYDESRVHHGSAYTHNADTQQERQQLYNSESSRIQQQAGFNSQHSSLSSDSSHQANYNSRQHSALSNSNSNAHSQNEYDSNANLHSDNVYGTITSKPKSYQSSYSYHKSWERQGDPYVITPLSNGQTTQRLTDLSGSQGEYSSHNFGSRKSHQTYSISDCVIECDPNSHIRKTRSYNSDPGQFQQQHQNVHEAHDWSQQSPSDWGEIQNLGQQSQNLWDNLGQQTQNLEDLGQQTQNNWDNLEQLGQQTQNNWEQQAQDAVQQVNNKWDKLEDLGQQTQNTWGKQTQDVGQQVQNKWDNLEDLGQHTQNTWDQSLDGGQHSENNWELGQQTQSLTGGEINKGQEISNGWNNLEAFGQQSEKGQDQETQDNWDTQQQEGNKKPTEIEDLGQHTQMQWNPLEEQDQRHNVSYEGTQQTEQKFDEAQAANNQESWANQFHEQEKPLHTSLNQHSQGFDLDHVHAFDDQNVFEQSINDDRLQEQSFQFQDFSQQTQDHWNHFEKEFLNNHGRPLNGNSNKPFSITNYVTTTKKPSSQSNTQKPKNTGSLNSLWGKLDNLDGDFAPSRVNTPQTEDTDFSQTSSSTGIWGKLDNLEGPIAPFSGNPLQIENTHFSQTSSSHSTQHYWNQQSLFNHDTTSNFAKEYDQHFNYDTDNFDKWSLFKENKKNIDQSSNTQTFEVVNIKSTTEKDVLVSGLLLDEKITTSTTEKPLNEDKKLILDIGRGDIGPEDSLIELSTSTTEKTLIKDDNYGHTYTTEHYDNKPSESFDEIEVIEHKPIGKKIEILDEETSPQPYNIQKTTATPNRDNITNDDKVPEETEQQFENQNIQQVTQLHNEQKIYDFGQDHFQQQSSGQENIEFGNFEGKNPEQWDQHNYGPNADQQFVDFSQTNQHPDSEQQNIEHELQQHSSPQSHGLFPDQQFVDFSQTNQNPDSEQQNIEHELQQHSSPRSHGNFADQQFVDLSQTNQHPDSEPQNIEHELQQNSNPQSHGNFADQQFVDFSQTNQKWHPEQENIQKQFPDDFYQQNQQTQLQDGDFNQHNVESDLPDFGQEKTEFEILPINKQQEKHVRKDYVEEPQSNNMKEKSISPTTEAVTEKPGFWKSIGNKFSSAKNKVASWFS